MDQDTCYNIDGHDRLKDISLMTTNASFAWCTILPFLHGTLGQFSRFSVVRCLRREDRKVVTLLQEADAVLWTTTSKNLESNIVSVVGLN
jgi:hypothetical protein